MGIDSSLMWGNMISFKASEPSRYVQEALNVRDMEKATKIDQNKIVGGFVKKVPDARTLAAIRSAKADAVTYDKNGTVSPSAHELAVGLVRADAAVAEAEAAAKAEGKPNIANIGGLDTTV